MSLSEQEQRILDDIEASLYVNDPNLDAVLSSAFTPHRARRGVLPYSSALVAFCLLFFSVAFDLVALGVVAFVVIVAAINYAVGVLSPPEVWLSPERH
jgi:hypothetical protein